MLLDGVETTLALHDLAQLNVGCAGILSPLYEDNLVKEYIHEVFLDKADHYVSVYQNVPHWRDLLKIASPHLAFDSLSSPLVLDLGSGGGNTVFALHELYPHARVIASDLSIPLLRILKANTDRHRDTLSCSVIQMNAEQIYFRDNQMDLVVGGSILHHLFDPGKTLSECRRVLKSGGSAVFFEPFELGHQVLSIILKQLIRINDRLFLRDRLSKEVVAFFEALRTDCHARKGTDKSAEMYRFIEDKWLFTRTYFESMARSIGFTKVVIEPCHAPGDLFLNELGSLLRIGLQKDCTCLPKWAIDVIREHDAQFSDEVRNELMLAGCVVFQN